MYGYNRNNEPVVEDIDQLLAIQYTPYGTKNIFRDLENILDKMYKNDELLTAKQLDDLVKKITVGKSRSLLHYHSHKCNTLNKLTERHLLTEKQINAIIPCIVKYDYENKFKWVDNLQLLGYNLTEKQCAELIKAGYNAGIDLIVQKNTTVSNEEIKTVCISALDNNDFVKLRQFLKKFNVTPDLSIVDALILQYQKTKYHYDPYGNKASNLSGMILILLEHGLPMNTELLEKLFKVINFHNLLNKINELFIKGKINFLEDIKFMFVPDHSSLILTNLQYIIKFFVNNNIPLDVSYLKNLMHENYLVYHAEPLIKSVHKKTLDKPASSVSEYKYKKCYEMNCINYYIQILELFDIVNGNYSKEKLMELLEHACLISDNLMFDILIKKLNIFTNKCVSNLCASGSGAMLNKLFNMKAIPTIECVMSINIANNIEDNKKIFTKLLENGLPINIQTIECALTKNLYIPNLEEYGYKPDIELYKLCYKYQKFPIEYINQLEKNPDLHMELRKLIDNSRSDYSKEQIIEYINNFGVKPDYMMYGIALRNKNESLVAYFENEWKMKPSLDALLLISDPISKHKYLQRIVDCHKIESSAVISEACEPIKQEQQIEPVKPLDKTNKQKNKVIVRRSRKRENAKSEPKASCVQVIPVNYGNSDIEDDF